MSAGPPGRMAVHRAEPLGDSANHSPMMKFLIFLLVAWLAPTVLGVVVEGSSWLAVVGIGLFLATGEWGLRVNRVEIEAIDPPMTIKDAMEEQMRAERDKRAAILSAEGRRRSRILPAEGDEQGAIRRAGPRRTPPRTGTAGRSSTPTRTADRRPRCATADLRTGRPRCGSRRRSRWR